MWMLRLCVTGDTPEVVQSPVSDVRKGHDAEKQNIRVHDI